jgi:glycerol-3-phosphate acyltransferase PlsY
MSIWIALLSAALGYLLGSVSFARIFGRDVAAEDDLGRTAFEVAGSDKQFELRSISASSIAFRKGPKMGCATSILDMLKAALPTLAFRLLYPDQPYHLIAAAAAVAGHNYPVYYRFRGGRGMSPMFGGLFVIDWLAIPVTTIGSSLIGILIFRDIFISYMGGPVLLIPWMWFRFRDWQHVLFALVVNVLFWTAAIPELKQYVALKRSGDIRRDKLLEGLQQAHSGSLIRAIQKRGWIQGGSEAGTEETDASAQ